MEKLTIENVERITYTYPTKYPQGFTAIELNEFLINHDVNITDFFNKLGIGHTCMVLDGNTIRYHHDILTALRCVIENRDMTLDEWDL